MGTVERTIVYRAEAGDPDGPHRSVPISGDEILLRHPDSRVGLNSEGALVCSLINRTGGASQRGLVVKADPANDDSFISEVAGGDDAIGVIYESGIADGSQCLIVVAGRCQVLLEDGTASTRGNGVQISASQGGRVTAAVSGGTFGQCIESQGSGTDVLAYVIVTTTNKTGLALAPVPNTSLSTMPANTVKVNATGGAATPTDLAMAASTILARLASGNIVAATVDQLDTLLATRGAVLWQPGGAAGSGVYTTWATAHAAAAALTQRARIYVDTSLGAASIPAGAYDMTNIDLVGIGDMVPTVTVVEGVTLPNFRCMRRVAIAFTGTTPVVTDMATAGIAPAPTGDAFRMEHFATIQCNGAGPFFTIPDANYHWFVLGDGCKWLNGTYEVVDCLASGRYIALALDGANAEIEDDVVRGPSLSAVLNFIASASIITSDTQTNFSGFFLDSNFNTAANILNTVNGYPYEGANLDIVLQNMGLQYTTRKEILTPLTAGTNVVAQQSSDFVISGGITNSDVPRSVRCVFAGGWDGGNVKVTGVTQRGDTAEETITVGGGGTREGNRAWAEITQVENLGTHSVGTVDIQYSTKLGLLCPASSSGAGLTLYKTAVDGVHEATGTVNQANSTVIPTSVPDGNKRFEFWFRFE